MFFNALNLLSFSREKLVERVKCMVSDRRLRCCFNRWVRFTVTSRNRRLEKQTFPACPSRLLLQDQAAMLKSKGERAVSSVKRKSIIEQVANVKKVLLLSGSFTPQSNCLSTHFKRFFLTYIHFRLSVQHT